jgi:hypothetical protein
MSGSKNTVMLAAGFCQAAPQPLGFVTNKVRKSLLGILIIFVDAVSPHLLPAAKADLVAGNTVELITQAMVEADTPHGSFVAMLFSFSLDPLAKERMRAPGIVDQQVKWAAKWLLKVHPTQLRWGT